MVSNSYAVWRVLESKDKKHSTQYEVSRNINDFRRHDCL